LFQENKILKGGEGSLGEEKIAAGGSTLKRGDLWLKKTCRMEITAQRDAADCGGGTGSGVYIG